ncbi:MAG: DUF2309 domain-containing protein [Pseudomonadota bacterium]|nr:DUF2309 domain-containing protein [Pseudomonadota bacterium]MDP1906405.1 DUF2309 domain-containing protein [Pseudomonadota bacterium]MDP2351460.1 DUF2309 domain-containing protein [Pseudomonadota bacterium]
MTTPRHAWLRDLLHHLEHILPAQAPIKDFVHHNTLHGFQERHFRDALAAAEAATGNHGYQSPETFRAYFRQGRIDLSDLNAALDETPELRVDESLPGGIQRRDILLAALRCDLTPPPNATLNWRIEELGAISRIHDEVPAVARERLLAGQPGEATALAALWRTCGDLLGLEGTAEEGARVASGGTTQMRETNLLWDRHRVKQEAERELATLMDQFAHGLSMRGLLLRLTGRDLMDEQRPYLIRHFAAHMDLGMVAWHNPARAHGFYAAWLESSSRDPHFNLSELPGCDQVLERLPADAESCIIQELQILGLPEACRAEYLETLALELPGWSGMFLWRDLHPGYEGESTPVSMLDYLAVRLVLERFHAQRLAATQFKTEASVHSLRAYLHHHPAELLVRLALYGGLLPEWLQGQGHRLVREAINHAGEEDDSDWLAVARLIHSAARPPGYRRVGPVSDAQGEISAQMQRERRLKQRWPLFLLCQHLGLNDYALARLGEDGAQALLACLADLTPQIMGWVFLQAYERHYRQQVLAALAANAGRGPWKTRATPPSAQIVFCIDDREEGLRRHLEELVPSVETLGAAAHFNVPHAWRGLDDDHAVALCPVVPSVVLPAHEVREQAENEVIHARHVERHGLRLRWKARLHQGTRIGLLGPTLMSLAAAPPTLGVLVGKAFAPGAFGRLTQRLRVNFDRPVATRIAFTVPNDSPAATPEARNPGFTDEEQIDRVQALLRSTGLSYGFSPLVVIMGHGSHSQNNPHGSAYSCGACAGRNSGPNARLVAAMANRAEVRAGLRERGIDLPDATWFIGAEHDTCDDIITWYDGARVPEARRSALERLKQDCAAACLLHAQERCRRFMSAPLDFTPEAAWKHVTGRANDYSQARPELGHATNASAFFGRRSISRGAFFDRRAFLVSYDPSQDPDGSVLERHLIINGAVGAGISLEYYFSSANNERYGCGTKVMHNVTGLLGVMDGAASDLRTGLPRQMIEVHEAMRILVVVEQRLDVLTAIYTRQPAIKDIVDNAWIQLVAIDPDTAEMHRFVVGGGWVKWQAEGPALPSVRRSLDWFHGQRDALPPALIEVGATSL